MYTQYIEKIRKKKKRKIVFVQWKLKIENCEFVNKAKNRKNWQFYYSKANLWLIGFVVVLYICNSTLLDQI